MPKGEVAQRKSKEVKDVREERRRSNGRNMQVRFSQGLDELSPIPKLVGFQNAAGPASGTADRVHLQVDRGYR